MQKHHLIASLLIVITFAFFRPVRDHEFAWDDGSNITENPYLRESPLSKVIFSGSGHINGSTFLSLTRFARGLQLLPAAPAANPRNGLDATLFHLVNLIVHTLSVAVVFVILHRRAGDEWATGAGALLFGSHPLQVEAVSCVTGMKGVCGG